MRPVEVANLSNFFSRGFTRSIPASSPSEFCRTRQKSATPSLLLYGGCPVRKMTKILGFRELPGISPETGKTRQPPAPGRRGVTNCEKSLMERNEDLKKGDKNNFHQRDGPSRSPASHSWSGSRSQHLSARGAHGKDRPGSNREK